MNEDGKDLRQLTHHQGFDIQSASLSEGKIVYSVAANLRLFDISSGAGTAIPVQFPSDFDKLREHWVKNPMDYLTSVHIPNDGGSVVLAARGRAFVVPAKQGRLVGISESQPGGSARLA
jgi:tricorn protease